MEVMIYRYRNNCQEHFGKKKSQEGATCSFEIENKREPIIIESASASHYSGGTVNEFRTPNRRDTS